MYLCHMTLKEYIESYPRMERSAVRLRIALATDSSISAVKHWSTGRRNVPSGKLLQVVSACEGRVPLTSLLPA